MTLEDIISGCGATAVHGDCSREIAAVTADSRKTVPGGMFIAVKGFAADGHDYIGKAVESGAGAVVYEDEAAAAPYIGKSGTAFV